MDLFTKTGAVKLRSHLDKYLVADDDSQRARQSRNGASARARWSVEPVEGRGHLIRLRSCHGRYLAASDEPFLLGMTGKRVLQASPEEGSYSSWNFEWEPVRDGFQVKLRSWCGKYLRANGGPPPWRNSVTHDDPLAGGTTNWVLWDVEAVARSTDAAALEDYASSFSSFSSSVLDGDDRDDVAVRSDVWSPTAVAIAPRNNGGKQISGAGYCLLSGMEFFRNAKVVRLRSRHDKYLVAEEDEEGVVQARDGSSPNARWSVEFVLNSDSVVRLKSRYGKYLTASNQPFLLGMTGRKVIQSLPRRLDSSLEWEAVREGTHVKLRTRYGHFLRANGGLPPWRNSVTHDVPHHTATQEWVLWDVDVIEIEVHSPTAMRPVEPLDHFDSSLGSETASPSSSSANSGRFSRQESNDSYVGSPPKIEGRTIYYHIADENGNVEGEDMEGYSLNFRGNNVEELTRKLEGETAMQGIIVCSRSPLNGKLFPLRLQLPPNSSTMHVVVVPPSSTVAGDFSK
ncbi:uncharacterized protein LOC115757635 isoform X2 [Rhodamnia argentea]|uniref:Uncharacterized protein LOC115757635 isoform X2 n=1 Tax=Rhodamnia argentea TaxID=178133 RepID=A0A8B8R593_9MYRT|nr:uncharacterized protein LOC115757635 isoform X2 [Rhodamnia argentea]